MIQVQVQVFISPNMRFPQCGHDKMHLDKYKHSIWSDIVLRSARAGRYQWTLFSFFSDTNMSASITADWKGQF